MGEVGQALSLAPAPGGLRAAVGDGVTYPGLEQLPRESAGDSSRWERGWEFRVPPCRPIEVGPAGCRTGDGRTWDPRRPLAWSGHAFGIEAQVECSLPSDGSTLVKWASDAFERGAFPAVATELYSGAVARAEGNTGNRWLTRSDDPESPLDELAATPGTLTGAVGLLESYLSCCTDGGHGVIHVPSALLAPMADAGLLVTPSSVGGRRYTWGGHSVVAECGYTGDEPGTAAAGPQTPEAGVLWLYGSGPVAVRVGAGAPIGTDEEVASLITSTNDRVAVVPGLAMAVWGCCHGAVPVDVSAWFETGS